MEFKIQRAWRILEMEEPGASAAITRHHLMVPALINSKVERLDFYNVNSISSLFLIIRYIIDKD